MDAGNILSQQHNFILHPTYHTSDEAQSACPFCRDGTKRFVIFQDGNYWCRKCEVRGWWRTALTKQETEVIFREKELSRQATVRRLRDCSDWKRYHQLVNGHLDEWQEHGLDQSDINKWQLGWAAPSKLIEVASLTIPIFFKGLLVDIRHRLLGVTTNKYRSHFSHTPPAFFNGDAILTHQKLFLVEGEKKAIICHKFGFESTISYPGVNMQDALMGFLHDNGATHQELVYIPDPSTLDAIVPAGKELKRLGHKVSVVELFLKPDDLLLQYGSTAMRNALRFTRKL